MSAKIVLAWVPCALVFVYAVLPSSNAVLGSMCDAVFPSWFSRSLPPTIKLSDLNSVLEVAIGFNLALSVIDALTSTTLNYFRKTVSQRSVTNPTFIEAMNEAAQNVKKQLNAEVDIEHLKQKLTNSLVAKSTLFETGCERVTRKVKVLAFFTALVLFIILCFSAFVPREVHKSFGALVLVTTVTPMLAHSLRLMFLTFEYRFELDLFTREVKDEKHYSQYAQDVMEIFSKKRDEAKSVEIPASLPGK